MAVKLTIEDKLFITKFRVDEEPHLAIKNREDCRRCEKKQCVSCCPAKVYAIQEDGTVNVGYEGCLECGTCRVVCSERHNIEWRYPTGGLGVIYRYG
jgi:ferredoxin like protein